MQTTMNQPRRGLPPVASNKRKERDETFDFLKPSTTIRPPKLAKPRPKPPPPRAAAPIKTSKAAVPNPAKNPAKDPAPNKMMLLAGCFAHEFLTKGTLFGQPWDPARSDPVPASVTAQRTMKQSSNYRPKEKAAQPKPEPSEKKIEPQMLKNQRYAQVSDLLKGNKGAHIPGIVNPTQLARFLHLK